MYIYNKAVILPLRVFCRAMNLAALHLGDSVLTDYADDVTLMADDCRQATSHADKHEERNCQATPSRLLNEDKGAKYRLQTAIVIRSCHGKGETIDSVTRLFRLHRTSGTNSFRAVT